MLKEFFWVTPKFISFFSKKKKKKKEEEDRITERCHFEKALFFFPWTCSRGSRNLLLLLFFPLSLFPSHLHKSWQATSHTLPPLMQPMPPYPVTTPKEEENHALQRQGRLHRAAPRHPALHHYRIGQGDPLSLCL